MLLICIKTSCNSRTFFRTNINPMALKILYVLKRVTVPFQIETVIFQYLSAIKSYLVQYYLKSVFVCIVVLSTKYFIIVKNKIFENFFYMWKGEQN